jgi:hypothetical protein
VKQMQRTIAADRIRRQRQRDEAEEALQRRFEAGRRQGRADMPPPVQLPKTLVKQITRDMAHMMAREAFEQNRARSVPVVKVLADLVEREVAAFPWDLSAVLESAQYCMTEDGVRFDFVVGNLRRQKVLTQKEIWRLSPA